MPKDKKGFVKSTTSALLNTVFLSIGNVLKGLPKIGRKRGHNLGTTYCYRKIIVIIACRKTRKKQLTIVITKKHDNAII